jgi:hypothetical protein
MLEATLPEAVRGKLVLEWNDRIFVAELGPRGAVPPREILAGRLASFPRNSKRIVFVRYDNGLRVTSADLNGKDPRDLFSCSASTCEAFVTADGNVWIDEASPPSFTRVSIVPLAGGAARLWGSHEEWGACFVSMGVSEDHRSILFDVHDNDFGLTPSWCPIQLQGIHVVPMGARALGRPLVLRHPKLGERPLGSVVRMRDGIVYFDAASSETETGLRPDGRHFQFSVAPSGTVRMETEIDPPGVDWRIERSNTGEAVAVPPAQSGAAKISLARDVRAVVWLQP